MANRALLVGINNYPSTPLNGCVNDVKDMANFLVSKCDFPQSEVTLLTDENATTEGIRKELALLVKGAKAGDRLFFHYSGHGSQMPIRVGSGVKGAHDVICPVDFDFTPDHAISDVDFKSIFKPLPKGVEFNWVSDSCHSGDLARVFGFAKGKAKFLMPPPDLKWQLETARSAGLEPPGLHKAIEHLNGALISGCKSDQTSADAVFGGRPNGALTFFLLETLKAKSGLTDSLEGIVKALVQELRDADYSQVPQLRGEPSILKKPFLAAQRGRGLTRCIRRGTVMLDVTMNVDSQEVVRKLVAAVQEQVADAIWEANDNVHGRGCDVSVSGSTAGGGSVSGSITCHF